MSAASIMPLPQYKVGDMVILTTPEMRSLGEVTKCITPMVSSVEFRHHIPGMGWHYALDCVTGLMPETYLEPYVEGDPELNFDKDALLIQIPVSKEELLLQIRKVDFQIGDYVVAHFYDEAGNYDEAEVEYGLVLGIAYDGEGVFLDYARLDDDNEFVFEDDCYPAYQFVKLSDAEFQVLLESRQQPTKRPALKVVPGGS